jgi:replicative DNA helicase
MMLYRDDYYNPGTEKPGVAEVNIVKNRSGQTGKVDLFFSKEFTQFSNYAKQDQQ